MQYFLIWPSRKSEFRTLKSQDSLLPRAPEKAPTFLVWKTQLLFYTVLSNFIPPSKMFSLFTYT